MQVVTLTAILGVLLLGAMFGFFYAWVCSTMWGLDAVDPRVAITAMQAMNASVRNAVFAPAMFGTPVVLFAAGLLAWRYEGASAVLFISAAVIYLLLGAVLTFVVHVPMNEALAQISVPEDIEQAGEIWRAYSPDWQFWNQTRTVACGVALVVASLGLVALPNGQGL